MQTETTSRETRSLIASDRVEGTPVRCTDGTTLGTIERVMIDKLTGNIAWYERHGFAREWVEDMGDRRAVHMMKRIGPGPGA